jgi:sarcosine oxidase
MKISRRELTKMLVAATVVPPALAEASRPQAPSVAKGKWDVAVIGAGVFGAWSAYWLRKAGLRVLLVDAYGVANSRASSGGESRIIRAAYGEDDFYSKWVVRSLPQWKALAERTGQTLFYETGVLTISDHTTGFVARSVEVLERLGITHEKLTATEVRARFPQIHCREDEAAVFEPHSGSLMARRSVQVLVEEMMKDGLDYRVAAVEGPVNTARLSTLRTTGQEPISAGTLVFACGPWLPKLFPELLGNYIKPERAEAYFLGVPAGDTSFSPPRMPTWIVMGKDTDAYGMPVLENRGFKVAVDTISQPADPDTMDREPTAPYLAQVRAFVKERFPALQNAPVVETRVCQYEYAASGNYLVDQHPEMKNVWIVGAGSGHGFKNGPALGEYVANVIAHGSPLERQLTLGYKPASGHRVD